MPCGPREYRRKSQNENGRRNRRGTIVYCLEKNCSTRSSIAPSSRMGKRKKWSKQKVIDAIRERERRGLSLHCVRKDDASLESIALRLFGSWNNALRAAGLESHVGRTWNKSTVLAAIKDYHQRGLPLNKVRKFDSGLVGGAYRFFGSWSNAMSAAGLGEIVRKPHKWSKQDVIDGILERKQRGLPMIRVDKHDLRLFKAAAKLFGGWRNAVRAAGLDPDAHNKWNKEKVIEQIHWWHSKGVPVADIYKQDPGLLPAGSKYFQKWSNALRAAGFDRPHTPYRTWSKRLKPLYRLLALE